MLRRSSVESRARRLGDMAFALAARGGALGMLSFGRPLGPRRADFRRGGNISYGGSERSSASQTCLDSGNWNFRNCLTLS